MLLGTVLSDRYRNVRQKCSQKEMSPTRYVRKKTQKGMFATKITLYVFGGHMLWRRFVFVFYADIFCGGHSFFCGYILWWPFVFAFFADICCGGHCFQVFLRAYLVADISFCVFADISCSGHSCTWQTQLALTGLTFSQKWIKMLLASMRCVTLESL